MGRSWQIAAAFFALTAPAQAAPAEIAFVGAEGIYSTHADGSGRTLLVAHSGKEYVGEPTWSPDGTRLAYVRGGEEDGRIMLRDAAGATRELTPRRAEINVSGLSWSPDGSTLAFTRITSGNDTFTTRIVTRNVTTGAERVLVTQKLDARLSGVFTPAWSPDGTTIAYTLARYDRHADGLPNIRTVPATGGPSTLLIRQAQSLAYSPDGTRLAYSSIKDHNGRRCGSDECTWAGELYVANADGSNARRLTRDEGELGLPAWSPDGSRILFSSDRNLPERYSSEIYSIAPDGSCFTWLTNGTPSSGDPAWRPGSGDTFAPASCDPGALPATVETPKRTAYPGNLWFGPKYGPLLLSAADRYSLSYWDCERFSNCPAALSLSSRDPCRSPVTTQTLVVRRGLLVAWLGSDNSPVVYGGRRATAIDPTQNLTLKRIRELVDALKVIKRETPRIPRSALNRLDAKSKAKLRPYRVCGKA